MCFLAIVLDIVCGGVMLSSAIKMKRGKTTLKEQKMKLIILSWLVIGSSLSVSIIFTFDTILLNLFNSYGFIGSLITLIGIYYRQHMTKRGHAVTYKV